MPLNLAYSFSRIQTFDCPRRFKKLYIEKGKEPSGIPAVVGQMAHQVEAYYLPWLYENKRFSNKKVLDQCVTRVLFEYDSQHKFPPEFEKSDIDEAGVKLDQLFKESELRIDPNVKKFWIEQKIVFDKDWKRLPDDAWFHTKGVYFRAIIDWAWVPNDTATLWISDHKSGWGEPDPGQLPYYAWTGFAGLGVHKEINRVGIQFHWIAKNDAIDDAGYFVPKELGDIRKRIDAKILEIENNTEWEPKAGDGCKYCGFTKDCPVMNKAWLDVNEPDLPDRIFAIKTMEDAEKGLELMILVNARIGDLKKELTKFYKANGPIVAAGKVFESHEKEEWLLTDPYGLQKELISLGIHPTDIIASTGLSKTKLFDLLKAKGVRRHYGDLIQKFGETNKTDGDPKPYVAKKEVER